MRRFYYVATRRSKVLHLADSTSQGTRTACGVRMWSGWEWTHRELTPKGRRQVCLKCRKSRWA